MAKVAKPAASADTDTAEENAPLPKSGRKKLIVIIAIAILLLGGGAAAFMLLAPPHSESLIASGMTSEALINEERRSHEPPKFVGLGTFTANLMHEEGDRYLQVAISLRLTRPELEEKIKSRNPEVLHRINMLLQSKRPSELADFAGKETLARQIKGQVEYVLGLRKTAPLIRSEQTEAPQAETGTARGGVADVLFTSFIIQ